MRYIYIKFKLGHTATFNMNEMRITKGYLKIVDHTYGNRAFPIEEIESMEIILHA